MEVMGVKFAPLQIPPERRLQTLAVTLTATMFLLSGPITIALFAYLFFYTQYYWLPLLYFAYWLGEGDVSVRGARTSMWVRRWSFWRHIRNYFPLNLVKTVDLDPSKNYLLCVFPHGLVSVGVVICFATDALNFSRLFHGIKVFIATLQLNFRMPGMRDLFLAMGFCSVSKESLNFLLGSPGTGRATVVVVGGAAEALKCKPGTYHVFLKNRKGFVKLALKNGASLVPVFSFGENDIYDQMENPEGSWLRWFQDVLYRVTSIALVVPLGRGFFQYSFGLLPQRRPITTVVGKPMDVERIPEPTAAQIDDLHRRFTANLRDLFETEKHKYVDNPEEVSLVIE